MWPLWDLTTTAIRGNVVIPIREDDVAIPSRTTTTGFAPDVRTQLPDVKLWVCEDTSCAGQVRSKGNPVDCPECDKEVLLAPMSRQSA